MIRAGPAGLEGPAGPNPHPLIEALHVCPVQPVRSEETAVPRGPRPWPAGDETGGEARAYRTRTVRFTTTLKPVLSMTVMVNTYRPFLTR